MADARSPAATSLKICTLGEPASATMIAGVPLWGAKGGGGHADTARVAEVAHGRAAGETRRGSS